MATFETPTDLTSNRGLSADEASFVQSDELRAWVADGLEQLS